MRRYRKVFVMFVAALFMLSVVPIALADEGEKININTAPVEELIKLKRIGPRYAERIVQYREANGPFAQAEDIMKVRGIGPKTYQANKDIITVE